MLEMKKRKENEWLERKREEKRRQANICAGETLEMITSEAWMMLLSKEDKRISTRLELAG